MAKTEETMTFAEFFEHKAFSPDSTHYERLAARQVWQFLMSHIAWRRPI
jgi:hypothetical protein